MERCAQIENPPWSESRPRPRPQPSTAGHGRPTLDPQAIEMDLHITANICYLHGFFLWAPGHQCRQHQTARSDVWLAGWKRFSTTVSVGDSGRPALGSKIKRRAHKFFIKILVERARLAAAASATQQINFLHSCSLLATGEGEFAAIVKMMPPTMPGSWKLV